MLVLCTSVWSWVTHIITACLNLPVCETDRAPPTPAGRLSGIKTKAESTQEGFRKQQCCKVPCIHMERNSIWRMVLWSYNLSKQGYVLLERQSDSKQTSFLSKKKKRHKWFFTVIASVALCFLDHTLSGLGRHSVPNCKLSPGPLTFCPQFPVLPLYPLVFRTAHNFRENHLSFTFISRLLFLFAFLHVPAHVQSFPVPVQPEMTSLALGLSLLCLIHPAQVSFCWGGNSTHSFLCSLFPPFTHSAFF